VRPCVQSPLPCGSLVGCPSRSAIVPYRRGWRCVSKFLSNHAKKSHPSREALARLSWCGPVVTVRAASICALLVALPFRIAPQKTARSTYTAADITQPRHGRNVCSACGDEPVPRRGWAPCHDLEDVLLRKHRYPQFDSECGHPFGRTGSPAPRPVRGQGYVGCSGETVLFPPL
jgi:hypothetical protein